MARKKAIAPKQPATENLPDGEAIIEPEDSSGIVEVSADQFLEDRFESRVTDFIQRCNYENLCAHLYLYKYINPNVNTKKNRPLQNRYDVYSAEDIPDEHTIGITYGGGKYLCILDVPKGEKQEKKVSAWVFYLAETYDELKKQNGSMQVGGPSRSIPFAQSFQRQPLSVPIENNFAQLKEMFAMFREMNPPVAQNAGMVEVMGQSYQMVSMLLRQSLDEQIKFSRKMLEHSLHLGSEDASKDDDDEPAGAGSTAPESGFLAQLKPLMPLIQPLIENVLGQSNVDPRIQTLANLGKQFLDSQMSAGQPEESGQPAGTQP